MPRELNYLTVDKECQAIKRELEALKHVLIGQQHLHPSSLQNMDVKTLTIHQPVPPLLVIFTVIRAITLFALNASI